MTSPEQPLQDFRQHDMSSLQITTVAICLAINMIDGFDVLAIAFTAPAIAKEWGMEPSQLGLLFSSGLVGMTLGSLILGPMADRYGRRPMILGCLVVISLGMLLSAFAIGLWSLSFLRFVTGLGIGGMLASINTLVAEYASDRRRELCISILQSGYPIGATIGGIISTSLIAFYDWRAVFIFGGLLSSVMIVIAWRYVVESIDFLSGQQTEDGAQRAQQIMAQMGYEGQRPDRAGPGHDVKSFSYKALFDKAYLNPTVRIWIAFFCAMFVFYFTVNWTPKVLVDLGLPVGQGISAGVVMNVGGVLGGLTLGYVCYRWDVRHLVAFYMVAAFVSLVLFGLLSASVSVLLIVAFIIGFFLFGSMIGLYTVVPQIYGSDIRTFGTGWAIGMGRIGGVAGPYVAGLIIASGVERGVFFALLSVPILLAAYVVYTIRMER